MKLDQEWPRACAWITDTSDKTHVFIGFLTLVAGRRRLAKRTEEIFQAVSRAWGPRMGVNEGIERCINILDPQIDRPIVAIHNPTFDGKVLYAADFISDQPARKELLLAHEGIRGCTFGVVESRTDWATFEHGRTSVRFSLMPEGTDPQIGLSTVAIPLFFQVNRLERNADHVAQLLLRMENHDPIIEWLIAIHLHVLPLPPRVSFEPVATASSPLWAGTTVHGTPARVVIVPRNMGDESLVPLSARVYSQDPAVRADPVYFHANQLIILTIDTTHRPMGMQYEVVFAVDYSATPGARGPAAIHVRGEVLPTVWQSMRREKKIGERTGFACLGAFAGLFMLGLIGFALAAHMISAWLVFLLISGMFVLATRPILATLITHKRRAGDTTASMRKVPRWALWWLPLGLGAVIALLCLLMPDVGSSSLVGALVGTIVGAGLGFIWDGAAFAKTALGSSPARSREEKISQYR